MAEQVLTDQTGGFRLSIAVYKNQVDQLLEVLTRPFHLKDVTLLETTEDVNTCHFVLRVASTDAIFDLGHAWGCKMKGGKQHA